MPSKTFDKTNAHEHLRDAEDTLVEFMKTLRRVSKHFPALEPALAGAVVHIDSAKAVVDDAKQQLARLP